jgi:hypothetical protein
MVALAVPTGGHAQIALEQGPVIARSATGLGADRIQDVATGPDGEIAVLRDNGQVEVVANGQVRTFSVSTDEGEAAYVHYQLVMTAEDVSLVDLVGGHEITIALRSDRISRRRILRSMIWVDDLIREPAGGLVAAGVAVGESSPGLHWLCRDLDCIEASDLWAADNKLAALDPSVAVTPLTLIGGHLAYAPRSPDALWLWNTGEPGGARTIIPVPGKCEATPNSVQTGIAVIAPQEMVISRFDLKTAESSLTFIAEGRCDGTAQVRGLFVVAGWVSPGQLVVIRHLAGEEVLLYHLTRNP